MSRASVLRIAVTVASLSVGPCNEAAAQAAATPRHADDAIVHLLNRIAYGSRPGDVERIRSIGVREYVRQQLEPESISDPELEDRLRRYPALETKTADLAAAALDMRRGRREKVEPPGRRGELGEQGHGAQQAPRPVLELAAAKVERAIHGERQLEEVMVDFWMNHFNVFAGKGAGRVLIISYERDAVRPHALGRFEDLLSATAHHPAMLFYLDNWLSVAPGAEPPGRSRRRQPPSGLNENYARELLELHTVGVGGGYTERDVIEIARAFTGWSIQRPRQGGGFVFNAWAHDRTAKEVLGHELPAGGEKEEGDAVLHLLATHPSTARHISYNLAQRFVADEPPETLIDGMAETWRHTEGDIREVLRTLFESPEFWDRRHFGAKVKTPFELLTSAARALELDVPPRTILKALRALNHAPYAAEAPTGYPEVGSAWLDGGALEQRVRIAGSIGGWLGRDAVAGRPGRETADSTEIVRRLFPGGASSHLAAALQEALAEGGPDEALALALASPEFQKQ
jgi:uncharacterized protein (DUF1800 family)